MTLTGTTKKKVIEVVEVVDVVEVVERSLTRRIVDAIKKLFGVK